MRKFLTRLVYQLDKPFYVWALLAGPIWAQNITIFAIWTYVILFLSVLFADASTRKEVLERARKDREFAEEQMEHKASPIWMLPSLAVAVTAASQAWFVSATFYGVLVLMSYGAYSSKKDAIKEIIGENQDQK
jgi:hypothetical protein